jgi:transposase
MKSFRRVKTVKGKKYVYEIQPYYDKATKKNKQKSKYIGKYTGDLDNAKPVRNNIPKKSLSYGEFIPLFSIIKNLKLDTILTEIVENKDAESILTIAMNRIINPLPFNAINCWSEGTILSKEYKNKNLHSQRLSELLVRISQDEIINEIQRGIINNNTSKKGLKLVYDITKLSSFSKLRNYLEYNKRKNNSDGLPQINFSLVLDKNNNRPLMFDIYNGSITDVVTLKNTKQKLLNYGIKNLLFIMDRGFFSATNIDELLSEPDKFNFIIPGVLTNKNIKDLIENSDMEKINYLKTYNNNPIFVKDIKLKIGKNQLNGYLYFDKKRAEMEKINFYRKLHEIFELIIKKQKESKKTIYQLIKDIGNTYSKYIKWDKKTRKLIYQEAEIENHFKRAGKFILLYANIKYDWYQCLDEYNKKICVEQAFDLLKNDLETDKIYRQNDDTAKGYLLIQFISLIIRMELHNILSKSDLLKKNTTKIIMIELSKIYKVYFENEKYYITELTKKQKDILKALNLCA